MAKNTKFHSDEEIVEVLNGCICCAVRKDLIAFLRKLSKRCRASKLELDAIVIETTGMADPAPVVQTLLVENDLKDFFRLDGIVTLIDAKYIEQHLAEVRPEGAVNESVQQVAFADRLLLNKVDLVPDEKDLVRIEAQLRGINRFAPIQRCTNSNVSVGDVLGIHGFDLQRTLQLNPGFLEAAVGSTKHDKRIGSLSLDQGAARHLRTVKKGELDHGLTQEWIGDLLESQGADLYRMKGVLAIAHSDRRFVFHAVHMTFDGEWGEPWAVDEPRDSKLVFIGKGLDEAALIAGFDACLATPANLARKAERLRFAVGDGVECRTGLGEGDWSAGEVVQLLYREGDMPPGVVAPYQVLLEDGGLIYAREDCSSLIRQPRRKSGRTAERGGGADDGKRAGTSAGGQKRSKHKHG
eukprot:1186514-Prymnesium_polylepis.2